MRLTLLIPILAAWLASAPLAAATADELLARIGELVPAEELVAGSPARAKAIAELVAATPGLPPGERAILAVAEAEAWLDARDLAQARTLIAGVARGDAASAALRERAGLALVATYRAEIRAATAAAQVADIPAALRALGLDRAPRALASALAADGERLLVDVETARVEAIAAGTPQPTPDEAQRSGILARYDEALRLLAQAAPDERTPLYALRVDAMERLRQRPAEVRAWLERQRADPAVQLVLESAVSRGDRLIGGAAPPLAGPVHGGTGATVDLAANAGTATVVVFFASWSRPSDAALDGVVRALTATGAALRAIGVSLDRKDTIGGLAAHLDAHGARFPVIAQGLGWDGDHDDAWHVEGLPTVALVDAQGRLVARDLAQAGGAAAIAAAIAAAQRGEPGRTPEPPSRVRPPVDDVP